MNNIYIENIGQNLWNVPYLKKLIANIYTENFAFKLMVYNALNIVYNWFNVMSLILRQFK